jgi:hypothetical protein
VGLLREIESLTLAARGTAVTLWDLWSTVDLQPLGYVRAYTDQIAMRRRSRSIFKPNRALMFLAPSMVVR